jgi:hypothetical protein
MEPCGECGCEACAALPAPPRPAPQDVFEAAEQLRASQEPGNGAESAEAEGAVGGPVELAARLPGALRVSSLTQEGIPALQAAVVRTLRRQAALLAEQEKAAAEAPPPPRLPLVGGPAGGAAGGGKAPVVQFFS